MTVEQAHANLAAAQKAYDNRRRGKGSSTVRKRRLRALKAAKAALATAQKKAAEATVAATDQAANEASATGNSSVYRPEAEQVQAPVQTPVQAPSGITVEQAESNLRQALIINQVMGGNHGPYQGLTPASDRVEEARRALAEAKAAQVQAPVQAPEQVQTPVQAPEQVQTPVQAPEQALVDPYEQSSEMNADIQRATDAQMQMNSDAAAREAANLAAQQRDDAFNAQQSTVEPAYVAPSLTLDTIQGDAVGGYIRPTQKFTNATGFIENSDGTTTPTGHTAIEQDLSGMDRRELNFARPDLQHTTPIQQQRVNAAPAVTGITPAAPRALAGALRNG